MNYVVELLDEDGKACRIKLALPLFKGFANKGNSTWRVLDESFFRYRSGGCRIRGPVGEDSQFYVNGDLYLYVGDTKWAYFPAFIDKMGLVNSSGEGEIWLKEAVISFRHAPFAWTLIE